MNWKYITGFFDADGSITMISRNKGKKKSIQVSFHNNELNILEEIQSFILEDINVKGHISMKKAQKETHNDSYELKYIYRRGFEVANHINSLHPKKIHRIKYANLIQKATVRNGKYTEEQKELRDKLVEEFFKI